MGEINEQARPLTALTYEIKEVERRIKQCPFSLYILYIPEDSEEGRKMDDGGFLHSIPVVNKYH